MVMLFDKRYVPLLWQANILVVANIVHRGMPVFNTMTITMMVDRWRLKTHSLHLPCGEMMVTLEDLAMILGLPIRGRPVTSCVESALWHESRWVHWLGAAAEGGGSEGVRGRSSCDVVV
jgi:hypothetical protein